MDFTFDSTTQVADSRSRSASVIDENLIILPSKGTSPLQTNPASSNKPLLPLPATPPLPNPTIQQTLNQTKLKPSLKSKPVPQFHVPPTYAAKARSTVDRSLTRMAPTTTSPEGKPQVLVPDGVFERGAALHREYLVGTFLGKMPDYGPIQSVLNYMWGKGTKLEIHLQQLKRSFLVRVSNEFIRTKILEKKLWYVETSMFYVTQWGSNTAEAYPEITSIPLWAHLRGVPFDLRTKEGLSLAAGLVREPIETDDYTKNITSLNVAHVKVKANLQKPLPSCGELVRENGEIISVDIDYPWVPPSCSHCNQIGHIIKNCINSPPPKVPPEPAASTFDPPASATNTPSVQIPPPNETTDQNQLPLPAVTDSQAEVDRIADSTVLLEKYITDEIATTSSADPSLATALVETAAPSTLSLPSPASSPKKPSSPKSPPFTFTSSAGPATIVVSLPALRAPNFTSYIAKKQGALFKSPPINLPPAFMDKSSATWDPIPLTHNQIPSSDTDPPNLIPPGAPSGVPPNLSL